MREEGREGEQREGKEEFTYYKELARRITDSEVPRFVVGKLDWCKFQFKSHQGQNLQNASFPVPVRRQEKTNIPAQDSGEKEFPLTQPCCSVQVFSWIRPIHTGENNLLYSAYQLKC